MTAADHALGGASPALRGGSLAVSLLLGVWFFLVFPTEPLYFENQNTKFLHGMALAGIGHLDQDWTAGTTDVMPVFTAIVYLLHVATPPMVAYLVQIALFAVFLYSVLRIADAAAGKGAEHTIFPVIIGVLTVTSQFSNGGARVWGGVAKQYLLGPALEPQSFGVLFLLAVVWFLRRRTEAALWLTAIPALVHPGYVVPAGALILAFVTASWLSPDKAGRPRLWVIAGSLAAAGASMVYLGLMILPTSAETWQRANEILATIRIPRHAVPAYWFDVDAGAKVAGLVFVLWLIRQHSKDLFWILAVCFGIAFSLTALAALSGSNELGMISPWRISVYLVPLGLAVLLGRLVAWALACFEQGKAQKLYTPLLATLAVLTVAVTANGIRKTMKDYRVADAPEHVDFMRETGDAQTLYLTDPHDMNIRLQSRLPQLVSWKTHPYKDVEVLDWYERFRLAARAFKGGTVDCAAIDEAVEIYGVTHLLLESPAKAVGCDRADRVFENDGVRIYRLSSESAGRS
jgi:hypothetical protein